MSDNQHDEDVKPENNKPGEPGPDLTSINEPPSTAEPPFNTGEPATAAAAAAAAEAVKKSEGPEPPKDVPPPVTGSMKADEPADGFAKPAPKAKR